MFFDQVYRDDEAMLLTDQSGSAVSSLLLQRYAMSFHGSEAPVSYIAGAATRRSKRGQGYMSSLMIDALRESAVRGDMLCSLIPADEALFFFIADMDSLRCFIQRNNVLPHFIHSRSRETTIMWKMMRVMRSGVRLTGFSVVGSAMFCIPDAISLTFCPI